jgi:hypothetical protein
MLSLLPLFFRGSSVLKKHYLYWYKNTYEDQCKRIEDLDTSPHSYAHLIFDKGAKNIPWRKDSLFNNRC